MDYKKLIEAISKLIPHSQAIEMTKWIDDLRKDNEGLRDEIRRLNCQIEDLKAPSSATSPEGSTCPNCSTAGRPFYMSPVPTQFVAFENATHECSKCKYKTRIE